MSRPVDTVWDELSDVDWAAFAQAWLRDLRGEHAQGEPTWPQSILGGLVPVEDVQDAVVAMSFSASPENQWTFIRLAVSHAESDDELGHIAAGPIEHLLGWHGEDWIERVEEAADQDSAFLRALTGVWKYQMSDVVWERVQRLQARVSDPLMPESGDESP